MNNLIISMVFIFIATTVTILLLNNKNEQKSKTTFIIHSIITFIALFVCVIFKKIYGKNLQSIYEIICWALIAVSALNNEHKLKTKKILEKKEKLIILISVICGLICLVLCGLSNSKYILPYDKYNEIGNYYFNADVHRAVGESLNLTTDINIVHPLYRFITLPILLPIILISNWLKVTSYSLVFGYIISIFQIILNSISALLIYRILKKIKVKESLCFIGSLLFVISFSNIWNCILPETYAITLVNLLLMLYLYIQNKKTWMIFATFAVGANLMCILPVAIILLDIFIKNKNKIKKQTRTKLYIFIGITAIISIPLMIYFSKIILSWSQRGNILEKICYSFNQLWATLICGPNFINISPYFVQTNRLNIYNGLIFVMLAPIALIGCIYKRKQLINKIGLIQLIVGGVLHFIIGYGANNGVIYAPLYSWAFIIFIIEGFEYIGNKVKGKYIEYIFAIMLGCIAIYNCIWLKDFSSQLVTKQFETPLFENTPSKVELYYSDKTTESLYIHNQRMIIQVSTGRTILNGIDTYIYNERENCISGVLKNSKWFKLEIINDELILNVSENAVKISKEKFYILGMGLRNKYILRYNNGKYDLIDCKNKNKLLKDLTLENIDYENYTVYVKDQEQNKITIYENEEGIYINKNDIIEAIQDNIKIDIPTFEGYEHRYQLRLLFNEIMVNITKQGVKPNFIAYENVWYRDAAIVGMALKETGNISQIEEWILNLNQIYDYQNGMEEYDNLGQVLYLTSLTEKKNNQIIEKVLKEVQYRTAENGYLNGITDGGYHPVYQTKWLIFGLKSLGLDYSKYKIPNVEDSYESLLWFCNDENKKVANKNNGRWEYIQYAQLHYNKERINFTNKTYPMSTEYYPSKAKFLNMTIIGQNYAKSKLIVPHAWSASEMFLYLLDLDRGKI